MKAIFSALVSLLVPILAVSTASAANLAPMDFKGTYKLVHARVGYCEDTITVDRMNEDQNFIDMFVGPWFFTNVNGGRVVRNDSFSHSVSNAYIRGNSMIEDDVTDTKIVHQHEVRRTVATLSKNGLLAISTHNSTFASLPTSCVYKRLPEQD